MRIEEEIATYLNSKRINEASDRLAQTCMQEVQLMLEKVGPSWRARPFGSFANGLCMQESDLDATCYNTDKNAEVSPRTNMEFLLALQELISENKSLTILEFVASARVPILKLRYRGTLDVDLSCNNLEPLPNTQLLRAYTALHPSVRDLALLVKCWAKGVGIVGAKDGHLSSYSLTLMVIYFMQVDQRINLPCLPVGDFDGSEMLPLSARVSFAVEYQRCALFFMFLNFYAFEFQWNDEVVGIHVGRRTNRQNPVYAQLKDIWEERLHIADPFLAHRNLNCVLRLENETLLYSHLQTAAAELYNGTVPACLRAYPEAPQWGFQDAHFPGGAEMPGIPKFGSQATPMFLHTPPPPQHRSFRGAPPPANPMSQQLALMPNTQRYAPPQSNLIRPKSTMGRLGLDPQPAPPTMVPSTAKSKGTKPQMPTSRHIIGGSEGINNGYVGPRSPPAAKPKLPKAFDMSRESSELNNIGGAEGKKIRSHQPFHPRAPEGADVPATKLSSMKF